MIAVKCTNKLRDNNNIIVGYEIVSVTGEKRVVSKDALKTAIANGQILVTNLRLAKDGKLVNRSTEEEAQIVKQFTQKNTSEEDAEKLKSRNERISLKANMVGTAVGLNDTGGINNIPSNDIVMITPEAKYFVHPFTGTLSDKTVIFTGNNTFSLLDQTMFVPCKQVIIQNPAIVELLYGNKINCKEIMLDFDSIDTKTLDIIFKIYKSDYNQLGFLKNITIKRNRLDKDEAINKADKILARQKPSGQAERRCYDIVAYLRLIKTLRTSYDEKVLCERAEAYIREYKAKLQNAIYGYRDVSHNEFLRGNLKLIDNLISELI